MLAALVSAEHCPAYYTIVQPVTALCVRYLHTWWPLPFFSTTFSAAPSAVIEHTLVLLCLDRMADLLMIPAAPLLLPPAGLLPRVVKENASQQCCFAGIKQSPAVAAKLTTAEVLLLAGAILISSISGVYSDAAFHVPCRKV